MNDVKLDFEQRQEASRILDEVVEFPEEAAAELVWLRSALKALAPSTTLLELCPGCRLPQFEGQTRPQSFTCNDPWHSEAGG